MAVILQAAVRAIESERKDRLFNDPFASILAGPAVAYVKAQMKKQEQAQAQQKAAAAATSTALSPTTPISLSVRILILQPMAEEGAGLLQSYLLSQTGTTHTVGTHTVKCNVSVEVIAPAQLKVFDPNTYSALVVLGLFCLLLSTLFGCCCSVVQCSAVQ